MSIIWSDQADAAFWKIRDYLFLHFGAAAEDDYLQAVNEAIKQVAKNPQSGIAVYELAKDGSVRSILVNRLSKFIYYVENDTLHIADVWDTRQNPKSLVARFDK